ncbi:g protein-coupled receptor [Anaeramoeba ignava]|uniref:G protein-coupled receptor n=1 Tax=Anaeramoeba ignava TaxID=1746090 RepID=A0A9Q0LW24_ANAIG|nr:g protein-coupled receptor [Anaeramoeba ignava]
MNLSEEISTIIGSTLGMIGALMIIIIFLYFKEMTLFYRKLVFILSIYDFFQSISFLLPGHQYYSVCHVQIYFVAIFGSTSQFWSAAISLVFYLKVVKQFDDKRLNKIQNYLHLIMWLINILFIVLAAFSHDYRESQTYWCIPTDKPYLIALYVICWIYLIACLVFYILTIIPLRELIKLNSKGYSSTRISQINQVWIQIRMSLIPLVEIIIMIPATIRRFWEIIKSKAPDYNSLDILQALLITSQGFWDFFIFIIFDPEMRAKIRSCCCSTSKYYQQNSFVDIPNYSSQNEQNLFGKKYLFLKSKENELLFENQDENQDENQNENQNKNQNENLLLIENN